VQKNTRREDKEEAKSGAFYSHSYVAQVHNFHFLNISVYAEKNKNLKCIFQLNRVEQQRAV